MSQKDAINANRLNNSENSVNIPANKFKTNYQYNSLNQLVYQSTPDGGITTFAYDKLGRIIASQNAKQIVNEGEKVRFSYTKYDYLGRIIEAGELKVGAALYRITPEGRLIKNIENLDEFSDLDLPIKTEVTRTVYTEDPLVETGKKASTLFSTYQSVANSAQNNRNRVTGVFYYENFIDNAKYNFDNAIFYNYDVHGNVKEVVNYNSFLKNIPCPNIFLNGTKYQLNDCNKHIKKVVYEYDLISGNVNKVTFQPNLADQFIHKYNYDADNRITNVETSPDGIIWEKDANYKYYPHGPLARQEISDKKVRFTLNNGNKLFLQQYTF